MNNPNTAPFLKSIRGKRISGKKAALLSTTALVIIAGFFYIKPKLAVKPQLEQQTAFVRRGDLKVSISGSGTLASSSTSSVISNVEGTITKIYFKDGDRVKAEELIAELDRGEAELNIKKLENNIAQSLLSKDQLVKSMGSSNITSPISGEITDVKFKEGDTIGKDGTLLTITNKAGLTLLLPFNNAYGNELYAGQKATVYIFDTALDEMSSAEATISFVSLSDKSEEKVQTYNVGFTIENTNQFDDTMIGSAEIKLKDKTLKSVGSARLSYAESIGVKTETGGLIKNLGVALGQFVERGDFIGEIENTDLSIELETKNLNLEDMYNQLEYAKEKLTRYKIYSAIEGTLSMENIKAGDNVKSGQTLFNISNYDLMEFQISVDELDIANIEKGQSVNITVDALPDTNAKPLEGKVTKIALEGTSSNGVSTYPVTVQLTKSDERLKVGMNVNGEIIVNEKKDTLYIPIEAVQKRGNTTMVYVKNPSEDQPGDMQPQSTGRQRYMEEQQPASGETRLSAAEEQTADVSGQVEYNGKRQFSGGRQRLTDGEIPAADKQPTESEIPATDKQPVDDEQPTDSEQPVDGKQPADSEQPTSYGERRFSGNTERQFSGEEQQGEGYYFGSVMKVVEIGINNDEYIEIIRGLNERDIVILPQSYTRSTTSNTQNNRFTGGGGMQGGMPFSMPGGQRR